MSAMQLVNGISTNLTEERLAEVLEAIRSDAAKHVPKSSSLADASAACWFEYQGALYYYEEAWESPVGLIEHPMVPFEKLRELEAGMLLGVHIPRLINAT